MDLVAHSYGIPPATLPAATVVRGRANPPASARAEADRDRSLLIGWGRRAFAWAAAGEWRAPRRLPVGAAAAGS
jgi:hypothetical protein